MDHENALYMKLLQLEERVASLESRARQQPDAREAGPESAMYLAHQTPAPSASPEGHGCACVCGRLPNRRSPNPEPVSVPRSTAPDYASSAIWSIV